MTYKITVSAQDIKDGHALSAYFCPIANALNRNLNPKSPCTVGTTRVAFGKLKIHLPYEVRIFICNFDRYDLYFKEYPNTPKPEPFTFNIDIPEDLDCNPIPETLIS